MSEREWKGLGVDQDVLDVARGLYESRVVVKRPPSAAQHGAYHTSSRGPPVLSRDRKVRPFSAKARITTERGGKSVAYMAPRQPPWRPFSGHASLSTVSTPVEQDINKGQEPFRMSNKEGDEEAANRVPDVYKHRPLPQSLVSLKEWLTDEVPNDWPKGYSPESSFIFLPCLKSLIRDEQSLPCVPPPQEPTEQLPYSATPQEQKYRPPKPRTKNFMNQEESRKNTRKAESDRSSAEDESSRVSHMRMYNKNGELIHNIYQGKKPAEVVQQEIDDLEKLLQGIGNSQGASIVVRYQHEINHLKDMVNSTLEGYIFPEEARALNPIATALQEDLVRYPDRLEEILATIRERRDECVKELATLEKKILHGNK